MIHSLITHGIAAVVFFGGGWWAKGKYAAKVAADLAKVAAKV